MIQSMTGYGRGEYTHKGRTATVELRSVNGRFFEVTVRLPRSLLLRENEVKEIIRSHISRGKISLSAATQHGSDGHLPLNVNTGVARSYYKLLNQLRKAVRLKEPVKLEHLLQFSEVFEAEGDEVESEAEWSVFERALLRAIDELQNMRTNEGKEIAVDLENRIRGIAQWVDLIEQISKARIPEERKRLNERITEILGDQRVIDQQRLELEVALLADKLDVTEECVRFRSHNKFFTEALFHEESAGRKLNFILQEMNREANTIGAKSNDASIAQHVVAIKEELEKIREQVQNIE